MVVRSKSESSKSTELKKHKHPSETGSNPTLAGQLPAPIEGGTESLESLGTFVDSLMGDRAAREQAIAEHRWFRFLFRRQNL